MDSKIINDVKRVSFEILKDERIMSNEAFDLTESENMDSIHRVQILTALEDEYDIIFKLKEISSWNTVTELATILENKL
jgi:acyl carrier protein